MAKGEILSWLDSDDFYNSGALQTVVRFFDLHRSAMLVYGGCDVVDDKGLPFDEFPVYGTDYRYDNGNKHEQTLDDEYFISMYITTALIQELNEKRKRINIEIEKGKQKIKKERIRKEKEEKIENKSRNRKKTKNRKT